MANEELIALLQTLQGSGTGRVQSPGLLAQLPALLETAMQSGQTAGDAPGSPLTSAALRTAGGGLTLLPVVSSILKLFGVGKTQDAPPALEKFALPAPIRAEAGLSQSGETFLIDRGVGDRIRPLTPAASGGSDGVTGTGGQADTAGPSPGASITVNVQAMDSQSFLDRREDIARAVREAMLQSHSLNDVVSEL